MDNVPVAGKGKWTDDEKERFYAGVRVYGWGDWVDVAQYIGTGRTNIQVKSHAQKVLGNAKNNPDSDEAKKLKELQSASPLVNPAATKKSRSKVKTTTAIDAATTDGNVSAASAYSPPFANISDVGSTVAPPVATTPLRLNSGQVAGRRLSEPSSGHNIVTPSHSAPSFKSESPAFSFDFEMNLFGNQANNNSDIQGVVDESVPFGDTSNHSFKSSLQDSQGNVGHGQKITVSSQLLADADYNNRNEYIQLPDNSRKALEKGQLMRVRLKFFLNDHESKRWWNGNLLDNIENAKNFIELVSTMCNNNLWRIPSYPSHVEDIEDILSVMRNAAGVWFQINIALMSSDGISLFDWERELDRVESVHFMIITLMRHGNAIKHPIGFIQQV